MSRPKSNLPQNGETYFGYLLLRFGGLVWSLQKNNLFCSGTDVFRYVAEHQNPATII
jgi:hypothetical protein